MSYFSIYILILKLVSTCVSKNDFRKLMGYLKERGWRLDFRGPNLFWQRGVDFIMSSPNADLIAVSLACPKDAKSPYSMYGASLQLSLS